MDVKDAIVCVLDNIKGVSQAEVARAAGVQRPQFNTYLRQSGTLPKKSIREIVLALLDELERISGEAGENTSGLGEAISTLLQFASPQKAGVNERLSDPTASSPKVGKKGEEKIFRLEITVHLTML